MCFSGKLVCFYLMHDDNFITDDISHFSLSDRGLGAEFMVHVLILLQKCMYLFLSSYSLAFL